MSVKYKPLYKWGSLNASPSERRRLICNSVFNLVSMVCIFWSIYVLIEQASLDARDGQIDWSFYVKISVVTIGLIIGVIFLFVQLKLYFSVFMKWRQSNRIIIIRNANFTNTNNGTNGRISNAASSTNVASSTLIAGNDVTRVQAGSRHQPDEFIIQMSEPDINHKIEGDGNNCKSETATNKSNDSFALPLVGLSGGKPSPTTSKTTQDGSQECENVGNIA